MAKQSQDGCLAFFVAVVGILISIFGLILVWAAWFCAMERWVNK